MALPSFLHRLASKSAAALRKQRSGKRRKPWSPLLVEALEERLLLSFKPAFLLLDPSAESSLDLSGNGVVQAPGGIGVVDSANRSAVEVSGNGYLSASELDIVGAPGMAISGNGKIQALVHTGIASQPDPLASLPVPQPPATTFTASKFSGDLYPGTYENGIDISGKATVTLHPGLYYVKGGLEISGQAHVTGAGVVIYVSPQKGQDGLEMSGDAVLTLSPPTSGTYKGITLFQARSAQEEIELTGNAQLNIVGTIYAAGGQLEITGNGQLNGAGDSADFIGSQFIGSDMEASGNGQITLDARDFNALTLTVNLSPTPGMEPNGTLVTNVSNSTISGTTGAFATVELGTNGDTHFGEGTTTADASGNYTLPVALTEGPNTLQIRVTFNGLQVTQTIEVTLDTVPPAITVTAPRAGLVTNQNVTMSGQVTDALSGVASFQAALDNGTFTTVSLGTGGAFNFTTALPLDHSADGVHTEHLRALDYAGNVSSVDVSFTLDTVPPTITVTTPAAGLFTNQNVTITGLVTDDRSGVASLQAALDNGSFAAITLGAGGAFSFATTLPLDHSADGSHTEHLQATDNAGNVSTFNVSFTLDTVPPTITVTAPAAGLLTNHNVTITGTVTDAGDGVATLQAALDNGSFAAVTLGSGGSFSFATTLPLDHTADGSHTEHLRATDNAGNVSTFDVSFTLDTVPPTITVTAPAAGLLTNHNVTITGTVTDAGDGVATLQAALDNGSFTAVTLGSGGSFSFATTLPLDHTADGSHTEHLQATDNAGNVSTFNVSFTLDTVPPTITVTAPAAGLLTNHNVTITGTVTDAGAGVATLQAALDNGSFAAVTLGAGGAFSFATTLPLDHSADGPHTEHLQATDNAGNVSTFNVSFTLDTVPPTITVTAPAAGLLTNQNITITGTVTDARDGVATLQAALDNGSFAAVTLGSGGAFSFATTLPLDHSADGPHTEHLQATDNAGNVSTFNVSFTLDTVPPTITVTAPAAGLLTNQNVTITGTVTDAGDGVASLQAALDNGSFTAVTLGSGGAFSFTTTLPLDHTADGAHTEHLKAADNAGNVSTFDVSFTLDTIPPIVTITSPTAPETTATNVTISGQATDQGSGVASVEEQVDGGAFTPVTFDASGNFSFTTTLALDGTADGAHTVQVQARDKAGNDSALAVYHFTLDTSATRGPTLVEGNRFVTAFQQTFTVPSQPSELQFTYDNLNFDPSTFIQDAFEASLTDANGNSLVLPISTSQDAFLNITDGQAPVISPNVRVNNGTVDVDLSHLTPGTQATLTVRLVNNYSDTGTTVHFSNPQIIAATMNTPAAVTPAATPPAGSRNIDFSGLSDVTTSMTAVYGETSLNEKSDLLLVGLAVKNAGTFPVDAPLVAVITGLSDPSVRVRNSDGTTPGGLPYFDLSSFMSGNTLAAGQSTTGRTLDFYDPKGIQFTYTLQILGQLNRLPTITSEPNTEAIPGLPYVYQATGTDPDNDKLTYSLLIAPGGMKVDPNSGKITWSPQTSDLGNETVLLLVDDGHGGTAQQQYTVSTIVAPPDRPPLFTSTPVIQGNVDTAYAYPATATDLDGNPLTFSLTSGPVGMSVDAKTGLVTWTPAVSQLGTANVTLTVADGHGGTATQSYAITVLQNPNDQPPRITSDPVTNYNVPPASNPPNGSVNPSSIQLTLANGQTSNQTVSANGLSGGPLTLGSLVTGNFGTPGQQDVYTFTLTANALLYFDALTDNPYFAWSLNGPAGSVVSGRQFIGSDGDSKFDPVLALPAGSYTLTVLETDPSTLASQLLPLTSVVGNYSFRLSNLAVAAPITPGTPFSGTLNPGDSTNLYQFTANAGQTFYFASLLDQGGTDFRDVWRLVDPFGNSSSLFTPNNSFAVNGSQFLAADAGRITLPFTGTYTVLVEGFIKEANPVKYTLNVEPIADTTQALTLGSTVNGNLAAPGQQDIYTFNLTHNSLLYFDSLTNNGNIQWSLSGPQGSVVSNRTFAGSDASGYNGGINPVLALPAGAYTLMVSGTGRTVGGYSFRLSDLAAAPALTPGTPVSTTLNPDNSTDLYQFSAAAGQSFYFASLAFTSGGPFDAWQLVDPYGNLLFSTNLQSDGGRLTLTAGGVYTVAVEGGITDTTTPSFTFNVAPITDTTQALTLGNTVNGTLADPGQKDSYTFNLAAHALLYFDAQTNNGGLQWSLTGPGGTAVNNRLFTASDGFSIGSQSDPVLSLPAGPYTLSVFGTGQTAGAYAFRLSDLSTAPSLTPGTATSGTLNPANSTNLYQLSGNAGDTYTFVAQGGKGNQFWRLIDPYGNVLAGAQQFGKLGPVTLLATGTYYLLVEGFIGDTGTANYTITAQFQGNTPPTPPSGTALTLGTTVSGTLATSTQQDHYFFTLPANALLYFDALSTYEFAGWSLSGPGGVVVSNSSIPLSDAHNMGPSPALALPAGTYILTIAPIDGGTGPYSFRLDNLASATPLTPGTPVSDTLNPANSTNFYQFNASAGQSFYFASLSGGSNSVQWRLIDPYGNQLFSTPFPNDGGRLNLTASGTYTVLIEGDFDLTGTLSYSFEAASITDTSQALALGGLVNGNLTAPGQQDSYTFNLAANTILYFDSLTNIAGIHWSLTGPPGTVVSNRAFDNSDGRDINGNPALAVPAGAYTLTVTDAATNALSPNPVGQTTGNYSFRLSNLASAPTLTPGTPISGTLNPANSSNFYQFNATPGQSFYFASLSGSGSARWRLIDPYGNMLFSTPLNTDGGRVTLTGSGTFTVLVEGDVADTGTDSYSFNVAPITDQTQALTLGNTINATFATPGEQDRYTFTLATSALLYFDSLTNSLSFLWTLTGPTGTVINNRLFGASDSSSFGGSNPALSLPAGAYTLLVDATGQTAGAYGFRLVDLATATPFTPGTPVSSTLNPANRTDLYQFSASAGEAVYFAHLSGGTGNTEWRLIDPYGNQLFDTRFTTDVGRLTLTAAGTYTLLIEGGVADTGTVSYSFNAAPITDPTQALTLSSLVNASLGSPGEQDHYTFTLSTNTLLYFDPLTNNSAFEWSLSGPDGTVVNNQSFTNGSNNPVRAFPAGSYTLTILATGQTTGAYAFRLWELALAPALTPGTVVTGTLAPANSSQLYQFNAVAGQSFYFASLSTSSRNPAWQLIDPYGNSLFRVGLFSDAGRLTLGATGTYTLLVEGVLSDTGTVNYSFNVDPITDPTQPLALGSLVNASLAEPGEQDHYTFSLSANAELYFDSLTNNGNFQWSLTGPGGTAVSNLAFTQSDAGNNNLNPLALPAGAYTLTVSAVGQVAGAYSFRLSNLASAQTLSLGVPVNDTLNPGNSTNIYQFNALAGQSFYFAHLSSNGSAVWRLIDPYGHAVFGLPIATDAGRLTLGAGAYTLLVEGAIGNTGTINYSFEVAPINDTTQALQLGSLVSTSFATPGEQDNYTFTLSSNALLYFDALTNNSNLQWSLTGPAGAAVTNRAFTQSDSNSIFNPVLSVPAGAYTLTVSGIGQTPGAYSFRLSNLAAASALTPGTPVSGSLNPADSTNLYQFSANAGDQFDYVHQAGSAAGNAVVRLIGPYGNLVLQTPIGFNAGPVTVPATGNYYLLVEGSIIDTAAGTYTINLPFLGNVPPNPTGTPITLGSTVTGTLATSGQQVQYVFTLPNATFTYFDALTNNVNLQWSLNGPAGTVVPNLAFTNSDGPFAAGNPVRLLPAGTYTLTVFATGGITGPFAFRLVDLSTAAALTPGTVVNGTLNPANSTNFYQFTATAGTTLYFQLLSDINGTVLNDGWRLVDPYGNTVFDESLIGFNPGTFVSGPVDAGRVNIAASGTYTLLIEGALSDTVSSTYSFNVLPITDTAQPLTLGTTVTGNLATPGQLDRYNFSLANAGLLYFDAQANTGEEWSLVGPSGLVANFINFAGSDGNNTQLPVRAVPAGNYSLFVFAPGATTPGSVEHTGAYTFRLSDLANLSSPLPLTLGTPVSGTLNPANSTNLYQFQATAGQPLYFARISGSGGSFSDIWRLIDPYGNVVFSTFLSQDAGRITLTVPGTYTLLVEGAISSTGTESYSFNVFPMADVSKALTLGSLVAGTLAAPGQQDRYSFTLQSNALLYFDSLTNNNNLQWSLSGPGGVVANRNFSNSDATNNSNPVMSLTAGNYVLTVNAPAPTTGPYSFRLSNLASAVPVNFDTQVSGRLNPGNSTNLYQFTANAGDSYYFESLKIPFALSGSQSTAIWRLVDPYGNILFSTNVGTDAGRITMPATGAYTLLIEGAILNPVETGYAFQIDQPQVNLVASDPNVPFVNQTGPVTNINAPSFNVQFAGDGQAQGFDVQFVSTATGIVLASVPVSIDTAYLYQVRAVDPQGFPLTYSLTQAPTGMTINSATGLITWVPTAAQVGQNSVTVQVEDTHGGTDMQSFTVTVTSESPGGIQGSVYNDQNGNGIRDGNGTNPPPPPGPFLPAGTAFPSIGVDKGPGIVITIGPDGVLTITNTGLPPFDSSDDTYVGVVNQSNSGVALQSLQLNSLAAIFGTDGDGIGAGSFVPGGQASNEGKTGYEGPGTYFTNVNQANTVGTVNFDDGLGDGLEPGLEAYFGLDGVPSDIQSTIVQQAPPADLEPGLAGVTVYLDLNHTGQLAPNDPVTQTDALGHYFFSNLVPGAYSVAEVTTAGLLQTAPPNGTYTAVVQSGQITSGLDFGNEVVTNAAPRPPKLTSTAPTTAAAGQTYRYAVSVFNPDDDVLSFDLPVKPDGMVVDALTGIIDWEPTEAQLGPQNVVLRLTDNKGDVVLQSFTVQVDEEAPPVITSTPPQQPAQTGLPYQYQVQAQDAQNDPITYSLLQAPAGMTIDPKSGLLSWVGPQVGPGLPSGYPVTIQADNGVGGQTTQTYTVLVITPGFDQPPVITSHPPKSVPPAPPGVHGTTLYYQVIANSPSGNPLTYSLPVAPTGMTINSTGLLHWVAFLSDIGSHAVTIQVEDSRGLTVTQSFTINVTYNFSSVQGPAITSVPPELARSGLDYVYDATANDPNNVPVIWSLDTAPAGMSVNAMTGTVRWTPNLNQLGSASVVLRATDTDGGFSTQGFSITVVSGDIPPNIVSTPPTQGTVGQLYTYAVQAKDEEGNTLTYSLVSAPTGMVINPSTGLIQWAPATNQLGTQPVVINVSDGQGGGAVQGYNIVVSSTAGSQPPTISSIPPLLTSASQLYSYQVAATDPQGETLSYSLINAPTGMSINPTSGLVQWTPATTQQGSNPVLLAVTNTDGEIATQNFTITVQPPNQPPAINSTPVTAVTAGAPYAYDVVAADPDNDALTYTLTTAPTGMTIDALGRIAWSPQIADIGNHSVAVSVSDGRGSTVNQQYTISVVADTVPPSVLLTLDANPVDLGTPDAIVVTATDNVGVTGLTLTLNGTPVPLDSTGRATLPDTTAGSSTLVATASDAAGNIGTDTQTLVVFNPQVTTAPTVALTTPADNGTATAPTQVIGTVQDPNLVSYTLSVAPIGSDSFTTFFTGTTQVTNGVLGTFDPTMLQNGSYDLLLTATNTGGLSSSAEITVNVSDKVKLGNFTLTFTDLSIPLSGIPITVRRTYDTLNANQSEDFGFGWSLEFRDVNLQTSVPSTGMEADGFFNPFQMNSKVYVTLPGGKREGFTFQPQLESGLAGHFLGFFEPNFEPDGGVTDSLSVAPANLRLDDLGKAYDFETGLPFNPADPNFGGAYVLTTNQGIAYTIDAFTGQLTSVSDANGHTLTFSNAAITSSTGVGITFERDPQGRIAAIVDPMGNRIAYQYDGNGNLVAVTDRSGNTTKFVYLTSPAHYLNEVVDPLGRTGSRTDYDAQGRLVKLVDVNGNPTQFAYDSADSLEVVTDQLGNTTTSEYDDHGNIVKKIDPLGAVTSYTFDANNDMLTETDPLRRTSTYTYDDRGDRLTKTDPLGNTTISTYQTFAFGTTAFAAVHGEAAAPFTRIASSTDPLGNTTTASYDARGNEVAQTDALGNTTTISNDGGLPAATTAPLGNVTTNQYDGAGNRTHLVDADGNVTSYTYDANGDPLTQTDANGGGWSLTVNADGMPTTAGPIGLPVIAQYDALNHITQITGPSGLSATLGYDPQGHMTQVTLPDGTIAQSSTYDAVGNLVASTDSLGNVTRYAYDADHRLVQTTYSDGSTEKRTYDLAGELVELTDALGNSTRYVYDGAGKQIQTIDALGGVSSTQYNAAGQIVATTDPLGRTTRFQYDADGRKVATIAPDGSTTRTIYDVDGRPVQTVDAAGNVSTYAYDPAGNLVSVTDALGDVTSYQYKYNERVAMTDAKGNTTRYSYDTQGHLVETTQPDGETDSTTYNSFGQLASTSNGNGQTISYGYDVPGRLTSVTLPDGSQETHTYTEEGLLSSVSDASGTTRYDYDPVTRRLVRVTEPDGRYIRYAYDALGNRTLMTDSMGAGQPEDVTQYAYDAKDRLVQVTDPQGGVTSYTYDADGNLITTTLPNGVTETDTYDTLNRLIAIVYKNAGGATIGGFSYTLDANGNRTKEVAADGSSVVYTYDALNRVREEQHFNSSGQATGFETYSYDALGNVTARSGTLLGNATFSYNGDNQLVSGAGSTYVYDAAGKLVSVTDTSGAVTRYSYDARGRLITSQAPNGTITSYTYDYQGVRQSQQSPGGLVKYLVDEASGPGSAQVVRESDATGATLRTYVLGARLLSFTEGSNVRYYLTDALGSTRLLTDPTGAVTDTYSYSAYGVLLVHTGSSDNPFLFAGQQQDGPSGLVYLRARYYDPATGRFLSRDAFAGSDQVPLSLNKYLYASGNPVNHTDPSGNEDLIELQEAETIDEEVDAEEDEQGEEEVRDLEPRVLQVFGALWCGYTVVTAAQDLESLADYFGGLIRPFANKTRIAEAAEVVLSTVDVTMLAARITYVPDELLSPLTYARCFPFIDDRKIDIGPNWANIGDFPDPAQPVFWCRTGVILHEFVHLIGLVPLNPAEEEAYQADTFFLPPIAALENADNYRVAVQGYLAGFDAREALESLSTIQLPPGEA